MAYVLTLALALALGIGAGLSTFTLRPLLDGPPRTQTEEAEIRFDRPRRPAPPALPSVEPAERLDPALRDALRRRPRVRMLVHLHGDDALGSLESAGLRVGTHHSLIGLVEVVGGEAELAALARLPCVRRVASPIAMP